MKTKLFISVIIILIILSCFYEIMGQWAANGNNIYNTNTGFVSIGNSSPATLLYVAKNMTEPAITVRNLGGAGGATYSMVDQASGANWKFKATNAGGFKIRDHAHALDVLTFEANSFANALYINSAGSTGMGTNTPAATAALEINSTTMGFLPPRMTSQQISFISNPVNGLVVYNTSDEHLYIYSSLSTSWKKVSYSSENLIPFICESFTVNHTAGDVAPVTKTVTYGVVMTNLTGSNKCWITQNLGADYQAEEENDPFEASAGWYWKFNRQQGYKRDGITCTPSWVYVYINEDSDWQLATDPCMLLLGVGWRIPTSNEWMNADANGSWDNSNETFTSVLKLHDAGWIFPDGTIHERGLLGKYWSSTQDDFNYGSLFDISGIYANMHEASKFEGHTLRCLKD